jgi:hypothetical protein
MKTRCWFISLALVLMACNLGPLLIEATSTATPSPTVTPTSTETPSVAPTAYLIPTQGPAPTLYFIPTQVPLPTAITCPKGTVLNSSDNRCYFATRTPDPRKIYCPEYPQKSGCVNHGCSWDAKAGKCS